MSANLNSLSDEELVLLEEELNRLDQIQSAGQEQLPQQQTPQQQQKKKSISDMSIPEELLNIFTGAPQAIMDIPKDLIFNPEQSPFEQGIGEVIRDVVIPVATQAPEFYNSLRNAGQGIGGKISELFGGPSSKEIQDVVDEEGRRFGISDPSKKLNAKQLQQTFDEFTDNKFKVSPEEKRTSRGKIKEASKDFVKDVATLANPLTPGKLNLLRSIGTAIAGEVVSSVLVESGFIDEKNKDLAKLGTWFMGSFVRPGAIREQASNFFKRADNAVKGRIITDIDYPDFLKNLKTSLSEAGGEVLKKNDPTIKFIDSLLKDVESGTFKGELLTKQVKNVNRAIKEVGGPQTSQGQVLSRLRSEMQNVAERVGESIPEFLDNFNEGNSLWRGLETKNVVSYFASKNFDKAFLKNLGPQTSLALGLGKIGKNILSLPFLPLLKVADITQRIATNPAARKAYARYISSALNNNQKVAQEAVKELDEELN